MSEADVVGSLCSSPLNGQLAVRPEAARRRRLSRHRRTGTSTVGFGILKSPLKKNLSAAMQVPGGYCPVV